MKWVNPFSLVPFNNDSPKIVTLFLSFVSGLFFDEYLSLFILFELLLIFALSSLLSENVAVGDILCCPNKEILSLSKVIIESDISILSILSLTS